MDPFTMMMGYGLVNTLSQLVIRPIADKMTQKGRREDMLGQMETKHRLDLELLHLNKTIDFENNLQFQKYSHDCRLAEAESQFDKQLKMWQLGQFNQTMWPLLTPFDHPSLRPQYNEGLSVPVNVFMAKTDPHSPFAMLLQSDIKNRLSNFLQTAYSMSPDHPCICRIGDWKDGFQDAAFINALWYGLKGQPCIIINPIQSEFGEQLDLNVSFWGLAQNGFQPITQTALSGPFGSAIGIIKKEETIRWVNMGLPASSAEMQYNITLLEQEKSLKQAGKSDDVISQLLIQYKLPKEIQTKVISRFSREYSHTVSCITGMYADIHHLIEYGAEPYMPLAINEYCRLNHFDFQIPSVAIGLYRKALTNLTCTDYLQDRLPYAYLNVAKALKHDSENAHEILFESIGVWANRKEDCHKEIPLPNSIDSCLSLLKGRAEGHDHDFLAATKRTLLALGEMDAASEIEKFDQVRCTVPAIDTPSASSRGSRATKNKGTRKDKNEWTIYEASSFDLQFFKIWIQEYRQEAEDKGAVEAVLAIRDKYLLLFFVDCTANIVMSCQHFGCCIIVSEIVLAPGFFNKDIIEFDLLNNIFLTNKTIFMDQKDLEAINRLGKSIDGLTRTIEKLAPLRRRLAPVDPQPPEDDVADFEAKLLEFFSNSTSFSMESETVSVADFEKIKSWINDQLPVKNAVQANIICLKKESINMVCIFFSDADSNVLAGDEYPKKRIYCTTCDVDLRAFLNGGLGIIQLEK